MRGELFNDDAARGGEAICSCDARVQIQNRGRGSGKIVGRVFNLPARFVV